MFRHAVIMRILSILLSLSMVLSTIGNGMAGFDCAANVTDAQGHGASYTYDKDSRLIKTLYSNGASETTSYNGAGHVKNLVNKDAAGNVISEYAYTYADDHTYYVGTKGMLVHNSCNHNSAWAKERRHNWKETSKTAEVGKDYGTYKATKANIARMSSGKAPIGLDGAPVHLVRYNKLRRFRHRPFSG